MIGGMCCHVSVVVLLEAAEIVNVALLDDAEYLLFYNMLRSVFLVCYECVSYCCAYVRL